MHLRQRWPLPDSTGTSPRRQEGAALAGLLPNRLFAWLSALMGLGLAITASLGIVLALHRNRGRKRWQPVVCLAAGCLLPVLLVMP